MWWWHICWLLCIFSVHKLSHRFQRRILHAWSGRHVHMATFGRGRAVIGISFISCGGTSCCKAKPRMSDANKDLSLFWIFLFLTIIVNSNLVQLINISQGNSRFKQINFSKSSNFQQLRHLSTRQQISQEFFMWWLFCPIRWFKPTKLIAWKIRSKIFCHNVFQWLVWLVQVVQYQKKIATQKIVTTFVT